tara:strand:- start:516 stop:731 length:216 start_codon:yes stop_codon:yes gene_type:complete
MTINVDCPPVENEEDGLFLMLYHLRMAAMYFETTPKTFSQYIYKDEHSSEAMFAWQHEMEKLYPEDGDDAS